jgi:hypothetical protein
MIVNSRISSKEEIRVKATASVVKGIALAVLLGSIAAIGAVLLGIGSFASMGALPLAVIVVGTLISAALSILTARSACIGMQVAELEGYDPEEIPKIKLCKPAASALEAEFHPDLCQFIDKGNKENFPDYQSSVHPHFEDDCVRDRSKLSIGVLTFNEMFPEEFAQIEGLKESCACLQEKANESGDKSIQEQADTESKALETCISDLRNKMIQKLTDVVTEKLGANSPLLTPISLALCQDLGIMLNKQMEQLSSDEFNGRIALRGTDPKISYTYALEFPQDEAAVAKITVQGSGYYPYFFLEEKEYRLETPCFYRGKMYISIDSAGGTSIESTVHLDC